MNVFYRAAEVVTQRGWSKDDRELFDTTKANGRVCLLIAVEFANWEDYSSVDPNAEEWGREYLKKTTGIAGYVHVNNGLNSQEEAIKLLQMMGREYDAR